MGIYKALNINYFCKSRVNLKNNRKTYLQFKGFGFTLKSPSGAGRGGYELRLHTLRECGYVLMLNFAESLIDTTE